MTSGERGSGRRPGQTSKLSGERERSQSPMVRAVTSATVAHSRAVSCHSGLGGGGAPL